MNDCNKCIANGIKCGMGSAKGVSCKAIREITEQSIRMFAEWLENNDYLWKVEYSWGEVIPNPICADTMIKEYEKQMKMNEMLDR